MEIHLIRHGQTAWNREQVFRGSQDVALDATGRRQAWLLGRRLRRTPLDAIYSGPLARALQTAKAIAAPKRKKVRVVDGLNDMSFGNWEGQSHLAILKKDPAVYRTWKTNPWKAKIPGGSSLSQVQRRSWKAFRGILSTHGAGSRIAVISHRVVLKLLFLRMLGLGPEGFWKLKLAPCSLSVVQWDGEQFVLERLNDSCHLKGMNEHLMDF